MQTKPQSAETPAPIMNLGWKLRSIKRARSLCSLLQRSSDEMKAKRKAMGIAIKHTFASGSAHESIRIFANDKC